MVKNKTKFNWVKLVLIIIPIVLLAIVLSESYNSSKQLTVNKFHVDEGKRIKRESKLNSTPIEPTTSSNEAPMSSLSGDLLEYKNGEAGFAFSYPKEWGNAREKAFDTPTRPGYLYVVFSNNDKVYFGGNTSAYTHPGRGGVPTDNPGYITKNGQFYTPEIFGRQVLIENAEAISTKNSSCIYNEILYFGENLGVLRCNLKSGDYYGVNFVANKPGYYPQIKELAKTFFTF